MTALEPGTGDKTMDFERPHYCLIGIFYSVFITETVRKEASVRDVLDRLTLVKGSGADFFSSTTN